MKLLRLPSNSIFYDPIRERVRTILLPENLNSDQDHIMTLLTGLRDYFNEHTFDADIETMNVVSSLDSAIFWYECIDNGEE